MRGPYNPDTFSKVLARSVVQTGEVIALTRIRSDWSLWLTRPIDADEDHRVVFWGADGRLEIQRPEELTCCSGRVWKGRLPKGVGSEEPLAVSLAFRGAGMGSAWDEEFQPRWGKCQMRQSAALARWFKLPLLADQWIGPARNFAQSHPLSCLLAWLLDREVDGFPDLSLPGESDAWFGVVRQLFKDWDPDTNLAKTVWKGLSTDLQPRPLFNLLLQVDPLLTHKLVENGSFSPGELQLFHSWASLLKSTDELAKDARLSMRVGDDYVPLRLCERFIKNQLDKKGMKNLEIAVQVGSFSRLLTTMLLEHEIKKRK
jgi:hypothetical protein